MPTAWGVFKAARMTGLDDRGDFYRAALSDRVAPRASISISLDELLAEARDDRKLAIRVSDRDGTTAEFFFGATTVTRGDLARRDAVLARPLEHRSRSRQSGT
jgi:hypothetical protein